MTEQTPNALIIVPCDDCGAIGSRPSPYGKPRDLGITPPRRTILRHFDVDDFGVARAQAAQFMAYGTGIVSVVEPLLALMSGRRQCRCFEQCGPGRQNADDDGRAVSPPCFLLCDMVKPQRLG